MRNVSDTEKKTRIGPGVKSRELPLLLREEKDASTFFEKRISYAWSTK